VARATEKREERARTGDGAAEDHEGRTFVAEADEEDEELSSTLEASVDKGDVRLHRSLRAEIATGLVGGADVALGVTALLLVKERTHSDVLAALAFSIGFIALTLAHSELFTENIILPITAVAAARDRVRSIVRLWFVVAVTNLAGGWLVMALVAMGFPELKQSAIEVSHHYLSYGIGRQAFAIAVLGGAIVALMTWMQEGAESEFGRIAAAVVAAFLLALGSLNHAVVMSLEMFAALQYGAPFGYASWLGVLAWATLGNLVGGTVLVAGLRLLQAGPVKLTTERRLSDQHRTAR
jgi:formate/nitrite transporter FocA (FNT family)